MGIERLDAVGFEAVLQEGRTRPLVLSCVPRGGEGEAGPVVVKAIGCPEVASARVLASEVLGNAAARRMGVFTPPPSLVAISGAAAEVINRNCAALGERHSIRAGIAAGARFMTGLAPIRGSAQLRDDLSTEAARLFCSDLAAQNPDRRPEKVNCALHGGRIAAFDFEMCFSHLFLPVIGAHDARPWLPSESGIARGHVFFAALRRNPPETTMVEAWASRLDRQWWEEVSADLPDHWREPAARIGEQLLAVGSHAGEFARDVCERCLQ